MNDLITNEQRMAVLSLHEGDIVNLSNKQTAEFIRAKQSNFLGIIDGKVYDIPFNFFVSIKEKSSPKELQSKKQEKMKLLNSLKPGNWFYITKQGNAIAYQFIRHDDKFIYATNPVSNQEIRVNIAAEFVKIK